MYLAGLDSATPRTTLGSDIERNGTCKSASANGNDDDGGEFPQGARLVRGLSQIASSVTATQLCTADRTFRRLFDAPGNATVAAHVRQTSLEEDPAKGPPEVLVEDGVNGRVQCRVHVTQPKGQ